MREGVVGNADPEEETHLAAAGGGGGTTAHIILPSIKRKKKRATQIAAAKVELFQWEEGGISPFTEEEGSLVVPTSASSRSATRRVTPAPPTSDGSLERALPNGDLYTGGFSGGAPHGSGKYLWADGCMYEGEWRRGKAAGKGKFSWPSGATYQGEFRSGRMEGFGTFIGADGDTYRGLWVADRKNGFGHKRYANGDYYEGEWRRNLQEGQGRYVWRNGNQYVGEWRNGVICGRGVLIWANGNRFDGLWENGVPRGGGVFTWPDGSCYVVNSWSPNKGKGKGEPHKGIQGTFYPPVSARRTSLSPPFTLAESAHHFYVVPSRKRSSVDDSLSGGRASCYGEKIFPRICIWESDGEAGDITCDIIDTVEASMLYRNGIEKVAAEADEEEEAMFQHHHQLQRWSPWCFVGGSEPKKPGHTISKGHKNYVLMRNLQLGIRWSACLLDLRCGSRARSVGADCCCLRVFSYSVGKYASATLLHDLRPADFDPREKFWTRFPPEGSKITPPHQSVEFRWKDYCPVVFRHLRKLFQVDPADYMLAICGNEALRELSSPGKSGSFFYLTQDDRFMIKTVKKSEVKVLIRMLPSYYAHVSKHSSTLLTKFFGVHCVKPIGGQKVRFVVMGNLFCSEYRIHRRFDLKGSSHGRTAEKPEVEIDETTTLKDLDLNFVFRLQKSWFYDLLRQIEHDCEFLEAEGIMDYSLLVGLHFRDDALASRMGLFSTLTSPECLSHSYSHIAQGGVCGMDGLLNSNGRKPVIRLGKNMPARAELVSRRSESDAFLPGGSEIYEVILYFGIIDILQDYDISKKLEHVYKSLQVDPTSISAVDPKLYSRRFRDFIHRIFVEDR